MDTILQPPGGLKNQMIDKNDLLLNSSLQSWI